MIKSLKVVDFQSHKDSYLEFSPYYNAIVGSSGNGKSSLVRALRLALYNQPRGDFFIRRPKCKNTTVEVLVDNDLVKRAKGDIGNEYYLNESKWIDFGTQVPQPIVDAIRIHPIQSDSDTEFNLQYVSQHEPHFLLLESDSVKAKFLNRLSGTHVLDIVLKDFINESRQISGTVSSKKAELDSLNIEYNKYSKIDALKSSLKFIEGRIKYIKEEQDSLDKLANIKSNLEIWQGAFNSAQKIKYVLGKINTNTLMKQVNYLSALNNLNTKYKGLTSRINSIIVIRKTLSQINAAELVDKINTISKLKELKSKYESLNQNIFYNEGSLKRTKEDLIQRNKEYDSLVNLKVCPTCGQSIKEKEPCL